MQNKTVKSIHHSAIQGEKLFSFLENQTLSDICIVASDEVKFHAHKCVLSASSDYFMAMFTSDLREATEREVKILGFNGELLKPILAFIYNGTVELQSNTIRDVLSAADYFQIKSLVIECYKFMGEELNAKNCLGIAMFAEQEGLDQLHNNAMTFASKHFEHVQMEEEFLELSKNHLGQLISNEKLFVSSEKIVFLSLIKWIEHDPSKRNKSAYSLFAKVRYWLLRPKFIKKHRPKLQMYQIECLELVCIWMEWHMFPDSRELQPMDV